MTHLGTSLLQLYKAHRALIASELSKIDLYPGQDGLLYHLSLKDGLTMTELVDKMQIKHPTLFTMVNRMVAAGLLQKDKDSVDKRASRIYLTPKGRETLKGLSGIWQGIEGRLQHGFSLAEMEVAQEVLSKLFRNLQNQSND